MANPSYSEFKERKAVAAPGQGGMKKRKKNSGAGFPEKPAFPSAGTPGKTQPKNRSAGVPRAKVHPKSEGI